MLLLTITSSKANWRETYLIGVPDKVKAEILEKIHSSTHLALEKTFIHGYPFKPTAMAFDPVQKVLAIGNKEGCIRLLGKPGIDLTYQHETKR